MDRQLIENARFLLDFCLGARAGESLLIVTDEFKRDLAKLFAIVAQSMDLEVVMIEKDVGRIHSEEPPESVASAMMSSDIVLGITTHSLTHTRATREACRKGVRIATMPGIRRENLVRAIRVDYEEMRKRAEEIAKVLEEGDEVRIVTGGERELFMKIGGRSSTTDDGFLGEKGKWGNLPAGEAALAPIETECSGEILIDGSSPPDFEAYYPAIGLIRNPMLMRFSSGRLEEIMGGWEAYVIKRILRDFGENERRIAELGIGVNPRAMICGVILEDEKSLGTSHIAIGTSRNLGGDVDAGFHLDFVFRNPTIWVDEILLMRDGELEIDI